MRKIIITSNNLEKSIDVKANLSKMFIEQGFHVLETYDEKAELIISIGGDGTFLGAIKEYRFKEIPLVGINTGHLGFLTEVNCEDIKEMVSRYINGKYSIDEVSLLKANICNESSCAELFALNEVVVKSDKSRVVHLDISVNNKYMQKFSGDGIIVSTSTGSTAYNYSAGGCIVDRELDVVQMTPMYPMNTSSYRSLTSSAVFSNSAKIHIKPEYIFEDSIMIVVDGVEYKYEKILKIELETSKTKVKLLRMDNCGFWEKVSKKFL